MDRTRPNILRFFLSSVDNGSAWGVALFGAEDDDVPAEPVVVI